MAIQSMEAEQPKADMKSMTGKLQNNLTHVQ